MAKSGQVHIGSGLFISHAAYEMRLTLGQYHQTDPGKILREQISISANLCKEGKDPFPWAPRDETPEQMDQWFREQTAVLIQRIASQQNALECGAG